MPGKGRPSPKRYAQAVFQLALTQDRLEPWAKDLQTLVEVTQEVQFSTLLDSPAVKLQDKLKAVDAALPNLAPLARNLLGLLAQRRAVSLLPSIREEYQRLADLHRGRQRVEVVSAIPLDDADQERIATHLSGLLSMKVDLQHRVQPSILGGLVMQIGDRLIDGSARNRLGGLRKSLIEAR